MSGEAPTARVRGLVRAGAARSEPVDVFPGQTWWIGRSDPDYLAAQPELARWHLAVPQARPDLSVKQLSLGVGRLTVSLTGHRGGGVTVDGLVRPSPVRLAAGVSHISPAAAGTYVDFDVTVLRSDDIPDAPFEPANGSGTTVALRIVLEPGSTIWRVAHALAWPVLPCRRRVHNPGWSGRAVAGRLDQLGWAVFPGGNDITLIGRELHRLAERVTDARLADGRRADQVLPAWPPWEDGDEVIGETRDQKAERRNRCVAEALWRARAVGASAIDGR